MEKLLKVSSSPHVRDGVTTQRLMFDVVIAMIPASVYGVWQFGMNALLVLIATVIASVAADGNKVTVKGLKVGTATITAKIGDVTATCEVTVDFATGLEEALANTEVFGRKGNIYVNPIQSLQVIVVNMIGKIVYNARINSYARIPVTKGICIVKLTNVGNTKIIKVNVY